MQEAGNLRGASTGSKKRYFLAGTVPSLEKLFLANSTYTQNFHL